MPEDPQSPEPEGEQPSGFETSFAPLPGQPTPETDVQERAVEPPMFPVSAQPTVTHRQPVTTRPPSGPTENVRVLHQVGPYAKDSIVPASCFSDIQRLLGLEAVEYTYETLTASGPDQTMITAMTGARPVQPGPQGVAPAPWSQATVRDILGPALPRESASPQTPGYTTVRNEWGNTMVVADRP